MAERFEQLYKFPENLYTEDAPIIIAAGALLKDNVTGSIVAQFKFHSISIKTIKALKISIDALDVAGQPLQNIEDYQYLDLSIRNGQDFGANKAIVMPSPVTRAISIANFTVVFSDNSKWGWDSSNELTSLPHPSNLRSMLHDAEMEKQYQISTNQYAKYVPCESGSLWSCACGEWNNTDYCTKCRLSKTTAFSALDISTLQTNMENRLAAEKAKREMEMEQQRIAAEKEAAKKAENEKKRKVYIKYGTIAAIVAAVILIIVGIISAVIAKNRDLTIDKLLTLETREDVISLLGKSDDSETEDSYDVTFMRNDYYMIVKYNDDSIDHCTLTYDFPGMANIELAVDMLEYEPTSKDISVANNLVDELLNTFNEKFGEPEVFNSPVSTTTYTWIVDSNEIELVNYIGNDELSLIGAIDIRIQYNILPTDDKTDNTQDQSKEDDTLKTPSTSETEDSTTTTENDNEEDSSNNITTSCNHNYEKSVIEKATCTASGSYNMKCTKCGNSYTDTVAALGHSMSNATCTQDAKCTRCGVAGEKAHGHSWISNGWIGDNVVCSYCNMDYQPNITVVARNLPVTCDHYTSDQTTVTGVSISSETEARLQSNGDIIIHAQLNFAATGFGMSNFFTINIYDNSGSLIDSNSVDFLPGADNTYYVELPDNNTYYIDVACNH